MSSEAAVPEEVWGLILKKVDSVREMGRLARVSRLFHGLITDAITQVRVIQIGPMWISLKPQLWSDEEEEVEKDPEEEDRFVELNTDTPARALSMVEMVARDAKNLEGVFLQLPMSGILDQQYCALCSQCLSLLTESEKPKLRAFHLFYPNIITDDNIYPTTAAFIVSKAATLKSIFLAIMARENPILPDLVPALQTCTQLMSAKFWFFNVTIENESAVLNSVLAGAHDLKSLQFKSMSFSNRAIAMGPYIDIFWGNELARLRQFACLFKVLEDYVSTMQAYKAKRKRFSLVEHPLQNVQDLALISCPSLAHGKPGFLSVFPFENFPHLRVLRLDCVDAMEVPRMVAKFLSLFCQQLGSEKALELRVEKLGIALAKWPDAAPPLDDVTLAAYIQDAVGCFCPTLHPDPECPNKKLLFQSGNAAFYLKVESYDPCDWLYDDDEEEEEGDVADDDE